MEIINPTQRDITCLCIKCGELLLQHGEESATIKELSSRLGIALGMDSVESAISSDFIVLTTIKNQRCFTTTRQIVDRGINMSTVTAVHHYISLVENKLIDYFEIKRKLESIKPMEYRRWVVVLTIGFSCACFCKINGGGWDGALVSFFASLIAMYVRLTLAHYKINPQLNFCIVAFVATTVSGILLERSFFRDTSHISMAATVLLLVLGFPLINAFSDLFKGNMVTGISRWATATMLTLGTCTGVVMALSLWEFKGWL